MENLLFLGVPILKHIRVFMRAPPDEVSRGPIVITLSVRLSIRPDFVFAQ